MSTSSSKNLSASPSSNCSFLGAFLCPSHASAPNILQQVVDSCLNFAGGETYEQVLAHHRYRYRQQQRFRLHSLGTEDAPTCHTELCSAPALFGHPREGCKQACYLHRTSGMVLLTPSPETCWEPDCSQPLAGGSSDSLAVKCQAHRQPDMNNQSNPLCGVVDCPETAVYGYPSNRIRAFCQKHRLPGMKNLQTLCTQPHCVRAATFGFPASRQQTVCGYHRRPGMVNLNGTRCLAQRCRKRASFGYPEEKKRIFCQKHQLKGMENLVWKRKRERAEEQVRAEEQAKANSELEEPKRKRTRS